jgi:mannose-6-phosphate isomerase
VDRLDNVVQRYAWGDRRAIWELLGVDPPGEPAAELWMGAHPVAPSHLVGAGLGLDVAIARDPTAALGPIVAQRFDGHLPFLFKVLAAAGALSLQAHPTLERARAGYRKEEAAGIPVGDPRRTYRDPNHKPELICALTPFEARCGFRDVAGSLDLLDELATSALDPLRRCLAAPRPAAEVLAEALRWLLSRPAAEARPLVEAVAAAAEGPGSGRFTAERAWTGRLAAQHPGDPGVVVALLLNHVELEPGEALFLGAGNLHCYLSGVGVEVMANSDNVVRGGLTSKHVDLDELLAVVDPTPVPVERQRPIGPVHTYRSPVPEFELTRLELSDEPVERAPGPRLVLVVEGSARLDAGGDRLELRAGGSAWVPAADGPLSVSGRGLAFVVVAPTPVGAAGRHGR